jgi:hypothetical protein
MEKTYDPNGCYMSAVRMEQDLLIMNRRLGGILNFLFGEAPEYKTAGSGPTQTSIKETLPFFVALTTQMNTNDNLLGDVNYSLGRLEALLGLPQSDSQSSGGSR